MLNSEKSKIILILLLVISLTSVGYVTALAAVTDGPELTIPSYIPAQANSIVSVPITFTAHGTEISSLAFSIDYDQTWLSFDSTLDDAITFNLPANIYGAACSADSTDLDGEIDCVLYDPMVPLTKLEDGVFLTIKLRTLNAPDGTTAPIIFSQDPAPSFGNTAGQSEDGSWMGGSVHFGERNWFYFLPFVSWQTPPPTTVTPTPVTPTPVTPTPVTPTPVTPTPVTPTPPPTGCYNLIQNGGFEDLNSNAWYIPITNYPANLVSSIKYTGLYSMRTGINVAPDIGSYSSVWQLVTIPSDAVSAHLNYYYRPQTEEPLALRLLSSMIDITSNTAFGTESDIPPFDRQLVLLLNYPDQTPKADLMNILSNSRTWTHSGNIDLIGLKGQTFWLYFASLNNGDGQRTAMYIDDVALQICR